MKSQTIAFVLIASTAFANGRGQDLTSAREFVKHIYAQYDPPAGLKKSDFKGPNVLDKLAPTVFSQSLLRLIRHDERTTPKGYVGKLDFDPICACQDSDGLQLTTLAITPIANNQATAVVRLKYPQPRSITVRLKLIQTAQGWRIDDIADPETPSLRRYLALVSPPQQ